MTGGTELSLARHVPRIALDWVVDTPDRRWKIIDGTMVFADISGFTALSERLATRGRIGAEELVETLSRVFGEMLDTAERRGGQLLKFGGDALLFLFTGDDHVRQAAATAVEIRAGLRRASDIVTSVGRLSLSISIGVHAGSFHVFLVGDPHRELVVLGPGTTAVVTAENAAVAGEIVVSPATAAGLPPGSVRRRADGEFLLRWRKASVGPIGRLPDRDTDREAARRVLPSILTASLDGTRPDPAHRVASVAFMRFSGTDAILADEGPDVLAGRLHETLAIAQAAFAEEDIALLCVDCDADAGKIYCSAGVPVTSEDDEGRLLRAVRAVVAASPPLPLQIGVNRGHVFAAELGTDRRAAYSAMGDTTNTAARICGRSEPNQIFVHPDVLEHARTLYESEPVGPFTFKGKALPQVLYRLGDEIGQRAAERSDESPFVGRADELAVLRGVVDRAMSGRGGAIEVAGAVGLGKSRLVDEALASVPDLAVMSVHAEPYGSANAFRIFRDPLRQALGIVRGTHEHMQAQVREAVGRLAPEHAPMLALIGDVVQVELDPSPEVMALQPQYRPDRTAQVVIDLLDALFPDGLVLVVEDAHWADDPSAHLVQRIVGATSRRPWVVVTVRRDEPGGVVVEGIESVQLEPLSTDTIRELAIAATESAPMRPHEIEQIVARAGGNPLFVGELVRATKELGSLDAVPSSLQGAMAAQVDALDPLAKRVLSYASVLGRSFRRSVLLEVLRDEELRLDEATVERLGRFLEADGQQRWRFRNGLLRDVVYDGLGFNLRSRLHLATGNAVERISRDSNADADTLALHFAAGGAHERAYRYALIAAGRSERSSATATAAAQLQSAIESARRVGNVPDAELRDLWIRLGAARDQAGLLDAALDALRRAGRMAADPVSDAQLLLRRAQVRERAGSFPVALREATMARRLVEGSTGPSADVVNARAAAFAATIRQRQERASDAHRLALDSIRAAESCGDREALARGCGVASWAGLMLGRDDSMAYGLRALSLYEQLDDPVGQAHMANNLGGFAYFKGDWKQTIELYERCVEACRRAGNITDEHLAAANIGEVLVSQGRLDEAQPLLRDAARVLRASGHLWGAVFADMHLGRLLAARGELASAERLLRQCMEENRRLGSSEWVFEAAVHYGSCLVADGRSAEALAVLAEAEARTHEDVSMFDAAAAFVRGSATADLGRFDQAAEAVRTGVVAARQRNLDFDLARLLMLADRLGLDDVSPDATEPAVEAQRLFDRLGVGPFALS